MKYKRYKRNSAFIYKLWAIRAKRNLTIPEKLFSAWVKKRKRKQSERLFIAGEANEIDFSLVA
jgi:hypothetical protein